MKVIILARGGSKGVPGKNIKKLNGVPLLAYPIISAHMTKGISKVYVSTDDDKIKNIALGHDAEVIDRPSEFAQDESLDIGAMRHAVEYLDDYSDIIHLRATTPMIKPHILDDAIDYFLKNKHCTSMRSAHESSNICEMPIKWKEAKNFYVFDDKGNRWIDMTSGIFVTNAGHSNPYINEAIKNQVDSNLVFAYQYNTDIRDKFIKKLLDISPSHFDKVTLLNSGSEATDAAYRLIKLWGKKNKRKYIVVFTGNYHGRVLGSELIGGTSTSTEWSNVKDSEILFLPFPKKGDKLKLKDLPPLNKIASFFLETYQGLPQFLTWHNLH